MKALLLLVFTCVATMYTSAQSLEYVCTPCGYDCDKTIYEKPGKCSSCGMALVEKSSVKFKNLSFDDVCKRLKANPKAILLDVRTPAEFNGTSDAESVGHFKNAININVEELSTRVGELSKYKGQEIIVYCSHSHRSPRATNFLVNQGFKNVSNVAGGVSTMTNSDKTCLKNNFVPHKK